MIKEGAERRQIESLLPWYAAGTLSRSDADRVEQALASDIGLARRVRPAETPGVNMRLQSRLFWGT